jgi:uncharacterized beta-barrel protein YwiB (DUF1934 family)
MGVKIHGLSKTRQWNIWVNMKQRCDNKKTKAYLRYGARKINYDKKWKSFIIFWRDMKDGYKDSLTLERIDNNKGYSKNNCKWATYKEQANNTKNTTFYTIDDETKSLHEWAEYYKINPTTVYYRLKTYKSIKKAFTNKLYQRD